MLAARDQENLVHARQPAGKPFDQNSRNLHPKTPSNLKTPFRPSRNDENQQQIFKTVKDGSSKPSTFVTPGPAPLTQRAPLGLKTTNARAQAFKTPAPKQVLKPLQSLKKPSTTRRSGLRSKIHVAPEPTVAPILSDPESDSEPEYGYAPRRVADLPDPPMDFPYDQTFPQFKGKNMFRGYGEIYCTSPVDENGVSIREKEEAETARKYREERLAESFRQAEEILSRPSILPDEDEQDRKVDEMIAAGPRRKGEALVDTIKAKSAAQALSELSTRPKLPAAAMKQTAASALKRQEPSAAMPIRSRQPLSSKSAPFNVSRNTIGFPKAKAPASIVPKSAMSRPSTKPTPAKVDQDDIHPKDFVRLYGEPPLGSRMSERLMRYELLDAEIREDEAKMGSNPLFNDVDTLLRGDLANVEVFQLEVPE